jgi:exonuclease SbcD
VLTSAMAQVRARLVVEPSRSVVLAHAFVAGGEASDSEREVSVGGSALVPATVFDGITYAALGHLHGPQEMAPGLRYSGSPLAMSFSEERHRKSVALVELDASGLGAVELLPCPVPRRLARVRARIDDLMTGREWAAYEDCYLQVTLTDAHRPREPMERLRARFPHVLVLAFDPEGAEPDERSYAVRLAGRSDLEVALDFVTHVRGDADEAEAALLAQAFDAVRVREAAS